MQRYLDTPVDEDRVSFPYKNSGKTVYQVELCRYEDGFESKKTLSRKRANLPPSWDETPLTTQRCSYRDFRKLFDWNVITKPCKHPPESLKPNYKAREILKVTTGVSEYNDRIGKLGTHVIENKLHGEIKDAEYCKIWGKIQLKNVGEPYKVIPPYPTQT
ncbi:uncharacterized protein LOC142319262 [Lycorma delicatula]|uniref:uncharacterized protein LOC142319262 n=1 Tax=Lycorma delicatula TaxID=130591 RepID=UPI003F50E0E2